MFPFQKSFETPTDLSSIRLKFFHLLAYHNVIKFPQMQAIQVIVVYEVTPWYLPMTTNQICPSYLKNKIHNLKVC